MSYPDSFHELTTVRDYTATANEDSISVGSLEQFDLKVLEDYFTSPLSTRLESLRTMSWRLFDNMRRLVSNNVFPVLKRFEDDRAIAWNFAPQKRWQTIFNYMDPTYTSSKVITNKSMTELSHSQLVSFSGYDEDIYRLIEIQSGQLVTHLKSLDVSTTSPTDETIGNFLAHPCLTQVIDLDISSVFNGRSFSTRRGMETLANSEFWYRASKFRALCRTISPSELVPLCQASDQSPIKLLDLGYNSLRTEGVSMICEAGWADSLTWLGLTQNYLDDDSLKVIGDSARFQKLRTLHIGQHKHFHDGNLITDSGVHSLANSPGLAKLRILTLDNAILNQAGVESLVNSPHWKLSGLGLKSCELAADSICILARSSRLARITWLDLSENELAGDALLPLAESPYLSRLCELDISRCGASDRVREILRGRLGPRLSD